MNRSRAGQGANPEARPRRVSPNRRTPWIRSIVVWLVVISIESVHGTLRQVFPAPAIGDLPARQVSVLTGMLLIFLVTWVFSRWLGVSERRGLLHIGTLWVVLTVLFEIALGRMLLGYAWTRILGDYDLRSGGLMGLGLLAMLFIPLLAARVRGG